MDLHDKLDTIGTLGMQTKNALHNAQVNNLLNVILIFPKKYLAKRTIAQAYRDPIGEEIFVQAQVLQVRTINKKFIRVTLAQNNYKAQAQIYSTYDTRKQLLKCVRDESTLSIICKVGNINTYGLLTLTNPTLHTRVDNNCLCVPIYPSKHSINRNIYSDFFRRLKPLLKISDNLDKCDVSIRRNYDLIHMKKAVEYIHYPKSGDLNQVYQNRLVAERRLCIEEFNFWLARRKLEESKSSPRRYHKILLSSKVHATWLKSLPFALRPEQSKLIDRLFDLVARHKERHLLHILQGDVGTGKTLVFMSLARQIIHNNLKVFIIVPSVLLGKQHYQSALKMFSCPVYYLHGNLPLAEKNYISNKIHDKEPCILISTTACFRLPINEEDVGLIVFDEQHKFGVEDINNIIAKTKVTPTVVFVTATPIPRTMGLMCSNLVTVSHLPSLVTRKVKTLVMSENNRSDIIKRLGHAIASGRQAYWVCPYKNQSWGVDCDITQLTSKIKDLLPQARLAVVTGDTPYEDSVTAINKLRNKTLDILISTTVIEVGIDIPQINIMIVESANRFGLNQLHQLRGRIGRDDQCGYCVLLYDANILDTEKNKTLAKLSIMRNSLEGSEISAYDMQYRGIGNLIGLEQSGFKFLKLTSLGSLMIDKESLYKTIFQPEMISFIQAQMKTCDSIDDIIGLWN